MPLVVCRNGLRPLDGREHFKATELEIGDSTRISLCDQRILLMDDFLPASQLEALWNEVQQLDYRSRKGEARNKHYPIDSGDLYEGAVTLEAAIFAGANRLMLNLGEAVDTETRAAGYRSQHCMAS